MKFNIEIDEENLPHIELMVAEELALKLESSINTKGIKNNAIKEFEEKKNEAIKATKMELNTWDKPSILFEMKNMFDKSWIKEVSDKVIEKLKYDSEFIAAVSTEIIKSKFK